MTSEANGNGVARDLGHMSRPFARWIYVLSFSPGALGACGGGGDIVGEFPAVVDAPAFPGDWRTPRAADVNPDPRIVEIALEAAPAEIEFLPGRKTPAWAYGGTVPGPTIEARAGDTVIVHFRNRLPEPTTIHWHGMRVPAAMDGVAATMTPVAPGATFDYTFTVADAGTFWYHPHVRSDEQVDRGLYGAFVVRGEREPELGREEVIVLDDVWLDADGQPVPNTAMTPFFGRQGNVLLAGGKPRPEIVLRPGERQRWRVVNAANARFFRLAARGGATLTQIGSESGLIETPRPIDEVLLSPGERVDLVVTAPAAAGSGEIVALPYDRGHHIVDRASLTVLRLRVEGEAASPAPLPASFAAIAPPATTTRTRRFRLEENHPGHGGGHHGGGRPLFSINGRAFPDITPETGALGASEIWEIENTAMMDHPFHLHGFRFQVLSRGGAAEPVRAWKDTVNVRQRETVRLAVPLDGFAGKWMYHCHILEHAEAGMMGEIDVAP